MAGNDQLVKASGLGQQPRLPLELMFDVVTWVAPADSNTLVPCSHSTTRTLLALSRVSRAFYPLASRYLRQHCLYIDSDWRLKTMLLSLEARRHQAPLAARLPQEHCGRSITSLFMAPFGRSLDDLPTAMWVRELFCQVCGTLKRLVIDMPLRSLSPADDHLNVRRVLREAFSMLTELEEFTSIRDELYLRTTEPEWRVGPGEPDVWSLWPQIQRMGLYNVEADDGFWHRVAAMPKLGSLVLTRADGLEECCMKTEYLSRSSRSLRVLLVNVSTSQPTQVARWNWETLDPDMRMRVMAYDVPTSFYGDEDEVELCQTWVKTGVIKGSLWGWEGELLGPHSS